MAAKEPMVRWSVRCCSDQCRAEAHVCAFVPSIRQTKGSKTERSSGRPMECGPARRRLLVSIHSILHPVAAWFPALSNTNSGEACMPPPRLQAAAAPPSIFDDLHVRGHQEEIRIPRTYLTWQQFCQDIAGPGFVRPSCKSGALPAPNVVHHVRCALRSRMLHTGSCVFGSRQPVAAAPQGTHACGMQRPERL